MIYFGTRLSENISRREPEGYLICLNVPVARTGMQEYLPEELGLDPGGAPVQVWRPAEEVFDPACMASFEGMPVTDDHPAFADGVNAENIRYLQKGHAHNVRQGSGKEEDLLLADLIITDPGLIEEILNGKREISCGYNYSLCEEEGRYVQRKIRGNHIAVVDAGRAGPRVSIRDHAKTGRHQRTDAGQDCENERSFKHMKQTRKNNAKRANPGQAYARRTARLMARMARDGETEELAEMIAEMIEPENPDEVIAVADPAEEVAEVVEEIIKAEQSNETPDAVAGPECSGITVACGEQIIALLQQILSLLKPAADCGSGCGKGNSQDEDPEDSGNGETSAVETLAKAVAEAVIGGDPAQAAVDPVESMVQEVMEEIVPEEPVDIESVVGEVLESVMQEGEPGEEDLVSVVMEPKDPEEKDMTKDALRKAIATFQPVLKKMEPAARREAVNKIAARFRGMDLKRVAAGGRGAMDTYGLLRGIVQRPNEAVGTELGKRIMAERNANLMKKN